MYALYLLIFIINMPLNACDRCDQLPKPRDESHRDIALKAAQQLECDKLITLIKKGVEADPKVQHNVAYCAVIKQEWALLANALNHPESSAWWNLAHQGQCTAECIKLLAQHKVDLNHPGMLGNTPLHNAVARRDMQTTEALIEHGAKVHAQNKFRQTPAHLVTEQMGEDLPTAVKLLLTLQKATLWSIMHTKDQNGNTPAGIINDLENGICCVPDEYSQKHCINLISSLQELKDYYKKTSSEGVLWSA